MSKGELWNILPYSGLWGPVAQCGIIKNLQMPPVNKVKLAGIPFSGDNSGVNPNLRLITFYADTLKGPVSTTGPRSTFFREYLNYKISWKIEGLDGENLEDKPAGVRIGFYTAPYTVNNPGPDNMLLMLEENGPALYKANECNQFRGSFKTSEVVDMFVVVDAEVVVKLKISASFSSKSDTPCFAELFKPYKYLSKCGTVMATQFLIDDRTDTSLLVPVKKYINTARRMLDYLFATSVNIMLFETPVNSSLSLNRKLLKQEVGRLVVLIPEGSSQIMFVQVGTPSLNAVPDESIGVINSTSNGDVVANYLLRTDFFEPLSTGEHNSDNWGFALVPVWGETNFKIRFKILIIVEQSFNTDIFTGFLETGRYGSKGWNSSPGSRQSLPGRFISGSRTVVEGVLSPLEFPNVAGIRAGFEGRLLSVVPDIFMLHLAVEYF